MHADINASANIREFSFAVHYKVSLVLLKVKNHARR